jgi:ribose transport system substrate-binding protein
MLTLGLAVSANAAGELVYLVTMDKMDMHWVSVDDGAKTMAAALGLEYKWDAPDGKSGTDQIEVMNNAIAENPAVILLAAVDPAGISKTVEAAQAAGIIVIYVDSPALAPVPLTLSTDNKAAGALAGVTMLAELDAVGKADGKIAIIGVNTATNSTMNREAGFREVIAADGRFEVLETEFKDGLAAESQEAATNFITGNPDLVGIFGTNEGSTVGTGNAIKADGSGIIGVGFDKSDAILGLLNDGSLKGAMAQNPYTMGFLGVAEAFAAINGLSTGPAVIDTGVAVLRGE